MKPLLLSLTSAILVMASCKKDRITPVPTTTTPDATISQQNSTFAGRPSTPRIKGKWRLVLVAGGMTGSPPTPPIGHSRRLHLRPDFTYASFDSTVFGTSTSSGTYSLSTVPLPGSSGTMNLITFHAPPGPPPPPGTYVFTPPPERYYLSGDTLVLWQYYAIDGGSQLFVSY